MNKIVIASHAASTFALLGLIWTIQCVHYPAFRYVSFEKFIEFHRFHTQQITIIVAPLMLIEIFTATALCFRMPSNFVFLNFASVLVVWILTACVSIPLHNQLSSGHDLNVINKLVTTNWPRTLVWTLRAAIWGYLFYKWESPMSSPLE